MRFQFRTTSVLLRGGFFCTLVSNLSLMASVKWSGLVSEMKGVLNGSVLSVGYGGQHIRNRVSGGGKTSERWDAVKQRLATVTQSWRTLSPAQQTGWQSMAASYPYIDKFGNPQTPSGYQLYVTLNSNRLQIGLAMLTTPIAPKAFWDPTPVTFYQAGSGTMLMSYSPNTAISAQTYLQVFATPAISTGITTPLRNMKRIDYFDDKTSSPFNLALNWVKSFGLMPTDGRVWFRWNQIHIDTGQAKIGGTQYLDLS